jgi:predicted dehydrogenase
MKTDGRIELVALCSRSEASLSRASKKIGLQNLKKYTGLRELLADPDIDLVDLVLPISIMPAIRASLHKHVISEKPCAPTVTDSLDLFNCYSSLASPPLWAVAENWRFKNATKFIEQIVTSGAIGAINFADFRCMTFTGSKNLGWRITRVVPFWIRASTLSHCCERWSVKWSVLRDREPTFGTSAASRHRDSNYVLRRRCRGMFSPLLCRPKC